VQGLHALDGERRGANAFDARAHQVEQLREVADLGLHGHIAEDRGAAGQVAASSVFSVAPTLTFSKVWSMAWSLPPGTLAST